SALVIGIERGIDLAAGFGQDQPTQQVRPPLRDAERDMPAARMAHQVNRSGTELPDEADVIAEMLGDPIGAALAGPMIREEMRRGHADQAMVCRQRADQAARDSKIVQRSVHADQWRSFCMAYVEIGHVVSVDVKGLHEGSGRLGTSCARFPESGWIATISKP